MPFALVFIGLILVVTGVKNTHGALGEQLTKDFTGPGNFFYWFAAIGVIGAAGAIPGFKPFSRMFMTLIIVAMVIRNGGVFDKFSQALANGPQAPERPEDTASTQTPATNSEYGSLLDFFNRSSQQAAANDSSVSPGQVFGLASKFLF